MAQKFAERLLILKEHGEALLERLYNVHQKMKNAEHRPLVFRQDSPTTKVLAKLTKDYPKDSDSNIDNIQGWDFVKSNLQKTWDQMLPIYQVFREVIEWTTQAQKTLEEICTALNIELRCDANMVALSDFLSIMTTFTKIVLLINRIDERKVLLSMYNVVYAKINGQSDSNVAKVQQLFAAYEKPFVKLQEVFFAIQNHVGRALLDVWASYERGDFAFLSNKRPLELLFEPDRIPYPSIEQIYFDLMYHEKINEWILYGYLVCPESIGMTPEARQKVPSATPVAASNQQPKRGLDLLLKALSQNYVLTIYGDESLFLPEPYEELFKKFKSATLSLKKEKKPFKAALEASANNAHATHKELRQYLRLQLKSLLNMLRDNNGLLGPKFQLVLSCLALAKEEIMWYFRHSDYVLPTKQKAKYKEVIEHNIGEMIFLVDSVSRLCYTNKNIVTQYHGEIIRKLYAKKCRDAYPVVDIPFEGMNLQMMQAILSDMENNQFMAMRLNWRRLQTQISGFQFKNCLRDNKMIALCSDLNRIYTLSRHVDDLDRELVESTSLKELYFFHSTVYKIFQTGLTGNKTQPYYSLAIIRNLKYYVDNVNKGLNPELRVKVGKESIKFADTMLTEMANTIVTGLSELREIGFVELAEQCGGDKMINRLKLRMLKQKEPARAGFESYYVNRNHMEKMRGTERIVTQLLYSLNMYDEIQFYDTVLYPTEYLRDKLEVMVYEYVKNLAAKTEPNDKKDQVPQVSLFPSTLVHRLRVLMNSIKFLEQCIHINTDEMVLGAVLETFSHLYVYNLPCLLLRRDYMGEVPFTDVKSEEKRNYVKVLADWYVEWVNNIASNNLIFAPLRKTFVSTKQTPLASYRTDDWMDVLELGNLVELIGPFGVRAFDSRLLEEIAKSTDKVRDILSNNLSTLKELESNLYVEGFVDTIAAKKMKNLDQLLSVGVRIGAMLTLRKLLHEALESRSRRYTPVIASTVYAATTQVPVNLFRDEKFLVLDSLANDTGLPYVIDTADNALKKQLAQATETSTAWEVLPTAYAAMLLVPSIMNNVYDVYLEGWYNNNHLAITTFHSLMLCVATIKAKEVTQIENMYDKFAEVAANLLLGMRMSKNYTDKQVNNAYIFADKIIKSTTFLKASVWEDYSPYSLIRQAYISIYEPHQKNAKVESE